jgi:DNA-binding response OmpR family regulator
LTPAQDKHDAQPYDLLLADLRMPDLSALDFCREMKHKGITLPVVIVTGKGDEETAVAALRQGAYDYIVKREDYLTALPYTIENAIVRFQLDQMNRRLQAELAELNRSLEQKVKDRTVELQWEIAERGRAEEALQRAHEGLEQRVAERTAELRELVRAMAGREVRMAELKEVIRKLRAQLQAAGLEPVADDPLAPWMED